VIDSARRLVHDRDQPPRAPPRYPRRQVRRGDAVDQRDIGPGGGAQHPAAMPERQAPRQRREREPGVVAGG
jgi:hypothetical protein